MKTVKRLGSALYERDRWQVIVIVRPKGVKGRSPLEGTVPLKMMTGSGELSGRVPAHRGELLAASDARSRELTVLATFLLYALRFPGWRRVRSSEWPPSALLLHGERKRCATVILPEAAFTMRAYFPTCLTAKPPRGRRARAAAVASAAAAQNGPVEMTSKSTRDSRPVRRPRERNVESSVLSLSALSSNCSSLR
jgi:hypothetical protein